MSRLLHHFLPVFSFGLALDEKVTADKTSAIAEGIAGNKDLTKTLLKACGVPVREDVDDLHQLDHVARRARDQHDVVVHPAVAIAVARARELIDRAKSAALADGKRPEQADGAAFAVVAWIDEIMARNPAYLTGSIPLQVTMFNTNNAGNEFFQHLSALKQDQDEVREVYYHAMLCGFVGQYYYENGDTGGHERSRRHGAESDHCWSTLREEP